MAVNRGQEMDENGMWGAWARDAQRQQNSMEAKYDGPKYDDRLGIEWAAEWAACNPDLPSMMTEMV